MHQVANNPYIAIIGPNINTLAPTCDEHNEIDDQLQLIQQSGINYQYIDVDSVTLDDISHSLHTQHYDGILITSHIRNSSIELFQQLVNTVRINSSHSKLLFNESINTTLDAIKRWFP